MPTTRSPASSAATWLAWMPDDDELEQQFREIVSEVGPLLVTDDMGVWDFFHGIMQTWDSLGMVDALKAARARDDWFDALCNDPMAGLHRIADEWETAGSMPEYVSDWVRAQMPTIVDWMK